MEEHLKYPDNDVVKGRIMKSNVKVIACLKRVNPINLVNMRK